ncbi:S8 family peptidase [Hydrogenimonas sp.]
MKRLFTQILLAGLAPGFLFFTGCNSSSTNEGSYNCYVQEYNTSNLPPMPDTVYFSGNTLYTQQWAIHNDSSFYLQNRINKDAHIHMENSSGGQNFLGRSIKVAIIDDGLDTDHEDLQGAIVATYDVATGTSDVKPRSDYENHGTEVTGIIAARNNSIGIAGVAPEVEVYFIRLPFDQAIPNSMIVDAFERAKIWGVDVINCSWGSGDVSDTVRAAIEDVTRNGRNGKGTVVVFSAGNGGDDGIGDPIGNDESSIPEVIAVGATNKDNVRSTYSNYGTALDVMAPGGEYIGITTLDQMGSAGLSDSQIYPDYIVYDDYPNAFAGTSASAPIVTGIVAQLLEANPNLTRDNVRNALACSADKIGDVFYDENGFNIYYGYGKVNAQKALEQVR